MSQHHCPAKIGEQPVLVVLGWDRSLQGFFLDIERVSKPPKEPESEVVRRVSAAPSYVYSSLHTKDAFSVDLNVYRKVLAGFGVTLPEAVFSGVEADRRNGVGNRLVKYFPDGSVEKDESF